MMLSQRESLIVNIPGDNATGDLKAMIDLPAELAEHSSDLFDKVFAFTFDVLGLQNIELRVRDIGPQWDMAGATQSYRERRA
jgi:hypothetical protein